MSTLPANIDLARYQEVGGILPTTAAPSRPVTDVRLIEVVGPMTPFGSAMTSTDTPNYEAADAYRGLVFFLANYRARNFARHMPEVSVEWRAAQGEFEPADEEHPWVRLLRRPNDYMAPLQVWTWMYLNRDLSRGAHFFVERTRVMGVQTPVALHPIFPSYGEVTPKLAGDGSISGWTFRRVDGRVEHFDADEVVRVAHESPFVRGRAVTLIEAAAYHIDYDRAALVYARDTAREQGKPDVVLEVDDFMEETRLKTLSRQFAESYRTGGGNNTPVSSGGLKVKPIQLHSRDQQFLEMRQLNRHELFEIFEVQESLFSDQAYATGQQGAQVAFATNTVQPNVEHSVNGLEFEFERAFRVDPDEAADLRMHAPNTVPVDESQRLQNDKLRIETGTPLNRVLRERGEDDVEGGDEPLVLSTLRPLADVLAGSPDPNESF